MKDDNVFPTHPEPIADTNTPYDDEEDEEEQEKATIDLENYFEIIMMISPVAGIKYYMHKHEATNAHVLMIQKPKNNPHIPHQEVAL